MNRAKLEYKSETIGVHIRKREIIKISEKDWRENVTSDKGISIKMVSKDGPVIKEKFLIIEVKKTGLLAGIYYSMEGMNHVEGSGMVGIKKPGNKADGDMSYNNANFINLDKGVRHGLWCHSNWLTLKSTYKVEEFLRNHMENGYVTVEVNSEISVNGEVVEDKKMKMKEALVSDINKFCSDESSSDFVVICEGKEIPCHKIILCSRCTDQCTKRGSLRNHPLIHKKKIHIYINFVAA